MIEKKWDLHLCCSSFAKLSASIFYALRQFCSFLVCDFFISWKSLIMYLWSRNLPGEVVLHSKLPLGFLEPTALSIPYKDQILGSEVECLATEEGNMILFTYSLIFLSQTWLCQTIRIKLNCRIQKLRELVSQWQWNILDFFYLCLEIVSSFYPWTRRKDSDKKISSDGFALRVKVMYWSIWSFNSPSLLSKPQAFYCSLCPKGKEFEFVLIEEFKG